MGQHQAQEDVALTARARPQYHYFYGSTENGVEATDGGTEEEQGSLIGEGLVLTDNDDETTRTISELDLPHLVITKGWWRKSEGQPTSAGVRRTSVIIALALAMSTFLVVLFPHTSQPLPPAQTVFIPFPSVERADYGDPVEGFIDLDLFHPNLLSDDSDIRTFVFPFPTGAFWTNLVVPPPEGEISYPVAVYPYAYKWSESEMQVSYPASHRFTDRHSIRDAFAPELTFSTREAVQGRAVTRFDPLSVTLRFSTGSDKKWESTLVQGSPYITIKYVKSTPILKAISIFKSVQCPGDDDENFSDLNTDDEIDDERRRLFGVCSMDDSAKDQTTMRGVQFIFKTQEGVNWIMFSSEPMNLVYDSIRKNTIVSSAPFTGIIRLAYIPALADDSSISSTGLRRLIYHAGVYPTGGDVAWDFKTSASSVLKKPMTSNSTSRTGTVHFNFKTQTMTDSSLRPNAATNGLLMLALPHHARLLPRSVMLNKKHFDLTYHCIKGPLTAVVGSSWTYEEPLLDLGFDGPLQGWDPSIRRTILDQVGKDLDRVLPNRSENIYGFGKQVARLAQLVHITHKLQVNDSTDDQAAKLLVKGSGLLQSYLEMFMSGNVADGVLYDSNMGGMVSANGLADKGEDFGNGRYNDHHFHYGYILYASAIMAKINSTFIDDFGSHVDALFHDVAHYTNGDSQAVDPSSSLFFPLARHKSWFDGHSWATGMFPFGDGKSQESSSEAVNCYYGVFLWALVRHGSVSGASDLVDFTRLLLAMEIRSAKTYWHMVPPDSASNRTVTTEPYNADFRENYMAGNVGMLDVVANTWFGSDPLYIHMINALPITAATAALFEKEYVSKEYPYLMSSRSDVEMAWKGYTTSIHAIVDPNKAWEDAQGLVSPELDSALSKSQVLYWISNRPGFNVTVSMPDEPAPSSNDGGNAGWSSRSSRSAGGPCEDNIGCASLDLTGFCCPTLEGTMLGCCT